VYQATVTNVGAGPAPGPVAVADQLPVGLAAQSATFTLISGRSEAVAGSCEVQAAQVSCQSPGALQPAQTLELQVYVTVEGGAEGGRLNTATVSTGGSPAPVATVTEPDAIGGTPPAFGLSSFAALLTGPGGEPDAQAGGHPYELTAAIDLNTVVRETPEGQTGPTSVHDVRDAVIDLPLGLAGSALAAPTCTLHQLASKGPGGGQGESACPQDTIIGHVRVTTTGTVLNSPLYNVVPERGVPTEFGFVDAINAPHILYANIAPTPAGYVLRLESRELTQVPLAEFAAAIYGEPAARDGALNPAPPMFTLPADCSGEPLRTTVHVDSWPSPGARNQDGTPDFADPNWVSATSVSPPVTGCGQLRFEPAISARLDTAQADSPTALEVNLSIPQAESAEWLGTPPLKDAVVSLPEGMTINPAGANGLQSCTLAQIGMSRAGVPDAAQPACPTEYVGGQLREPSKIGAVEAQTPTLPAEACREPGKGLGECPAASEREPSPLRGSIYLATPYENPFPSPAHPGGSLLALYIVIDDPRTGLLLKLPGEVKADPSTGRLTIAVPDSPQLPLSQLRMSFFGGSTALLQTPARCGSYDVGSQLTPWSAPASGPPATPAAGFEVTQGCAGAGGIPFDPSFTAGAASAQAASSPRCVAYLAAPNRRPRTASAARKASSAKPAPPPDRGPPPTGSRADGCTSPDPTTAARSASLS
jgi:uncharacterized repeat protein (TIGR01451 family)